MSAQTHSDSEIMDNDCMSSGSDKSKEVILNLKENTLSSKIIKDKSDRDQSEKEDKSYIINHFLMGLRDEAPRKLKEDLEDMDSLEVILVPASGTSLSMPMPFLPAMHYSVLTTFCSVRADEPKGSDVEIGPSLLKRIQKLNHQELEDLKLRLKHLEELKLDPKRLELKLEELVRKLKHPDPSKISTTDPDDEPVKKKQAKGPGGTSSFLGKKKKQKRPPRYRRGSLSEAGKRRQRRARL